MKGLMITLLAAMLVLAACGGSQLDDNDQLPPPPGGDDVVVQVQDDLGNDGDEPATEDAKSEFDALASKAEGAEFMVKYKTINTFEGVDDGEFTMYSKGERSRRDSAATYEGQVVESQVFVDGDSVTMCNKQEGDWSCMIMEDVEETGNTPADFQEGWDEPDMDVSKKGSRTIAGTKAECYGIDVTMPGEGSSSQEVCISKEGIMLYMAVETPQGEFSWEAEEYSTSVSDSAFTPPAEPQDMEAMMQQMMEQYQ